MRSRRKRAVVQAIVAKGADRNDNERKFITGLAKAGLAAQADGAVAKSETAVAEAEGGAARGGSSPSVRPRRSVSPPRPAGCRQDSEAGEPDLKKPSLQKDEPEDAKPQAASKPASGSARQQPKKSGQRKGQQRPKHPSSKK